MAASSSFESGTADSSDIPEYLDPRSPKFDPQRALYNRSVPIQLPEAKQFNNLAEFENYLKGNDAKTQKLKKKKEKSGILAIRDTAKVTEAERKAAIMAKNAGPSERSNAQLRRNRPTKTVLTRMEGYVKGPLSFLRHCVEERIRVIVVIRAAVAVRSRCRGYIIAFDKHFNMALMDVDEKFIRPVAKQKVSGEKSSKSTNKGAEQIPEDRDRQSITNQDSPGSSHRIKLVGSNRHTHSQSGDRSTQSGDRSMHSRSGHRNTHSRSGHRSSQNDLRDRLKQSLRHFDGTSREYKSDSDTLTSRGRKQTSSAITSKTDHAKSDSECIIQNAKEGKLKKRYTPFWPLYKKWTEMRCYSEYEIVDRHVNQIFVRGDNVVSVSIAEY